MKYFATKNNITELVIKLQNNLLNFIDYGNYITEPKHKYLICGYIETPNELSKDQIKTFSLIKN